MKSEKTIDVLNTLITINNDRIEGYETASKETEEKDLQNLFGRFIATSQKFKQELIGEVSSLGGEASEGTMASGKFFRAWMDVKAALTGKDRKAILNSCEYGEEHALETYDNALEDDLEHISVEHQTMINAQRLRLKSEYDHLQTLRDQVVKA